MFEKILVPIDGSEHSRRAVETAVQIARKFDSKLLLLTVYHVSVSPVVNPELPMGPGVVIDKSSSDTALEAACRSGERILTQAAMVARSEKTEVETELVEGSPVEEIVKISKERTFNLIVMGARGLSTIRKLLIGSVSEGVIKNAPCPVLIVK